jgi:DNA-directed RNA polymerase specialized sigma24 family protein
MTNAKHRDDCPEVAEIFQSKILRNYIKLRLYVLKMNNALSQEDVINHVALCLVETLQSGKLVSYPIAWAKKVSERYINSQFSKFKSSEATDSDKIEYFANHLLEQNKSFYEDEKEEIRTKIKQLTPGNQKILIWRFFKHFSWSQIAELLSQEEGKTINVATARKRGERALDELRKRYR